MPPRVSPIPQGKKPIATPRPPFPRGTVQTTRLPFTPPSAESREIRAPAPETEFGTPISIGWRLRQLPYDVQAQYRVRRKYADSTMSDDEVLAGVLQTASQPRPSIFQRLKGGALTGLTVALSPLNRATEFAVGQFTDLEGLDPEAKAATINRFLGGIPGSSPIRAVKTGYEAAALARAGLQGARAVRAVRELPLKPAEVLQRRGVGVARGAAPPPLEPSFTTPEKGIADFNELLAELDEIPQRQAEISERLAGLRDLAKQPRPVRPNIASGISDDAIIKVAQDKGLDPYNLDWADALDPKRLRSELEYANQNFLSTEGSRAFLGGRRRAPIRELQTDLANLRAREQELKAAVAKYTEALQSGKLPGPPPPVVFRPTPEQESIARSMGMRVGGTGPAAQAGMGIGEKPAQGTLLAAQGAPDITPPLTVAPARAAPPAGQAALDYSKEAVARRGAEARQLEKDIAASLREKGQAAQPIITEAAGARPSAAPPGGAVSPPSAAPPLWGGPPTRPPGTGGGGWRPPGDSPPRVPGDPPRPGTPASVTRWIADRATQGELPSQTLLRTHEGAITAENARVALWVKEGSEALHKLGIGVTRRGQLVPRTQDIPTLDALNNALHNPSRVASGEIIVPKGYEAAYKQLRASADWEEAARIDFDPNQATIQDYFYRGWRMPEGQAATSQGGGPLVKKPAFKKPRVDATYQEMRAAGFEPLFWNPYQQAGFSRMQGHTYREQMELVAHLKGMGEDFIRPHAAGVFPPGWRVPEVGPAFEGKPFATVDATGAPVAMRTQRYMTLDSVADMLENAYGKPVRPDLLGKVTIGGKVINTLDVADWLTFVPKRTKLIGAFFQHLDYLQRNGAGSWAHAADALASGHPVESVMSLARYPQQAVEVLGANFVPGIRKSLAQQLTSTTPLLKGRPGVHLLGISEAGLSHKLDTAMFPKDMDKLVRRVADETGVVGKFKQMGRAIGDLEHATREGLFEGTGRAAVITDIKNNIAQMTARMYPELNDLQLNGVIARIANVKYSMIPASQSIIQNRVIRETGRRVFFSINEAEGLLRQSAGAIHGPQQAYYRKHWLGTFLFLSAVAETIHYASTGKLLPWDRFNPISKDDWSVLPISYNTKFLSPTLPFQGRGGSEITLDLVNQMDTALRVLHPLQFLSSRESVPIRALLNQFQGKDFLSAPIDDVGPAGVVSRTAQLATDLFSPIGPGGIAAELARRSIPGGEKVVPEGESRLGLLGQAFQGTGVNLRAATNAQLYEAMAQKLFGKGFDELVLPDGSRDYTRRRQVREEPSLKAEIEARREQRGNTSEAVRAKLEEKREALQRITETGQTAFQELGEWAERTAVGKLKPGEEPLGREALREKIKDISRTKRSAMARERKAYEEFAQQYKVEEFEETLPEAIQRQDFLSRYNNADLLDVAGDWNYSKRQGIKEKAERDFGKATVQHWLQDGARETHPIIQGWFDGLETYRNYFETLDDLLESAPVGLRREIKDLDFMTAAERDPGVLAILEKTVSPEALKWQKMATEMRKQARRDDSGLDAWLFAYGYVDARVKEARR